MAFDGARQVSPSGASQASGGAEVSDSQKNFWCWCPDLGDEESGAFVNAKCFEDAAKAYARHRVFCEASEPPCRCSVFVRDNSKVKRFRVFGELTVIWSAREVEKDE